MDEVMLCRMKAVARKERPEWYNARPTLTLVVSERRLARPPAARPGRDRMMEWRREHGWDVPSDSDGKVAFAV